MAEKRSSANSEKTSEPTAEAELANIVVTGADRKNKTERPCEGRLDFRSEQEQEY